MHLVRECVFNLCICSVLDELENQLVQKSRLNLSSKFGLNNSESWTAACSKIELRIFIDSEYRWYVIILSATIFESMSRSISQLRVEQASCSTSKRTTHHHACRLFEPRRCLRFLWSWRRKWSQTVNWFHSSFEFALSIKIKLMSATFDFASSTNSSWMNKSLYANNSRRRTQFKSERSHICKSMLWLWSFAITYKLSCAVISIIANVLLREYFSILGSNRYKMNQQSSLHPQFGGLALTPRCARTERHRPETSSESLACLFLKNLKIS